MVAGFCGSDCWISGFELVVAKLGYFEFFLFVLPGCAIVQGVCGFWD